MEKKFNQSKPDLQIHMVFQEPGEKEAIANQYGIIGKGLDRMDKRPDGWYMDNEPIDEWKERDTRIHSKDPEPWKN